MMESAQGLGHSLLLFPQLHDPFGDVCKSEDRRSPIPQ